MEYKISVVIRTYNEQKHIGEVLESLKNQNYKNYEVILVDSESTDRTLEIANHYNVKIIKIKKAEFDYSYASNIGVKNATGDIICFLSGHSVPVSDNYLLETNKCFQNLNVGGCYGDVIALEDGSVYEKIYNELGVLKNRLLRKDNAIIYEKNFHKGMLSCSNASIRKSVLLKYPFAKELGKCGGEDLEIAYRILQDNMIIVMNPKLIVKHSHGNNLVGFIKEILNWKKIYKEVLCYIDKKDTYL